MIVWTREASDDFESIREYIAADKPAAAAHQCDRILQSIDQIDRFPKCGRVSTIKDIRQLSVPNTSYIVFYRLSPDAITLIGILHGAMHSLRRLNRTSRSASSKS